MLKKNLNNSSRNFYCFNFFFNIKELKFLYIEYTIVYKSDLIIFL